MFLSKLQQLHTPDKLTLRAERFIMPEHGLAKPMRALANSEARLPAATRASAVL